MATRTQSNIGIRRFIGGAINEHRNFEPGGTVHYVCNREGMLIGATTYHVGDALPLGILPDEKLEPMWNAGEINPAT